MSSASWIVSGERGWISIVCVESKWNCEFLEWGCREEAAEFGGDRGRQILPDLAKKDKFDHLAGVSVEEFTAVGQCFVRCSH